jgi:hypothetical protein
MFVYFEMFFIAPDISKLCGFAGWFGNFCLFAINTVFCPGNDQRNKTGHIPVLCHLDLSL